MNTLPKFTLIAVAGTNGSGKDTVAAMLAKHFKLLNVTATEMLRAELVKQHLPADRTHKSKLSAQWRRKYGMGVIVDKALDLYLQSSNAYNGFVVSSLRHPGEVDRVHELGGTVLWIDGDIKLRYQRIQQNLITRGEREAEDNKTFEEFSLDESREMTPSGDGATLNMSAVKEQSDYILYNEGTPEEFLLKTLAILQV